MTASGRGRIQIARSAFLLLIGFTALGFPPASAWAQTGAGTVSGTVRDTNEAVVPEANVTITNTQTGLARNVQTSAEGVYYFGALPIGPYKVAVEKQGFETWTGTLTLFVGQNALVNATLRVGNVKTVVEVSGAAPPITTTNGSTVSDTKDYNQIRD